MRRTQSAMVLAVLISLPAIWAGGAAPAVVAGQPLTVILVDGPRLRPADVRHAWTPDGLEVSGRVQKRYDYFGRIVGHVNLDLLDADGSLVARHAGALQRFSPSRRNPDWASFYARIEDIPAEVVAIRVEHAVGSQD